MIFARSAEEQEREHARCEQAFDTALANGGFGPGTYPAWNAYVNRDLLLVFGEADRVAYNDVVRLFVERAARRTERYPEASWRNTGNLLHYGIALGLVAEERDPERGRGWRLLHREPHWISEETGNGTRARQVLGLPPEEQAAERRRQARLAKLRDTLDRKARAAADAEIAGLVALILAGDPDAVVPEFWLGGDGPYGDFVPAWLPGTRIDACVPVLREAHHPAGMPRPMLKEWIRKLRFFAQSAPARYARRLREQAAAPATAEIPADDASALEALR